MHAASLAAMKMKYLIMSCCLLAASSSLHGHNPALAVDEDVRTRWSVACGHTDSLHWKILVDKQCNDADVTHQYIMLTKPTLARYIRATCFHV